MALRGPGTRRTASGDPEESIKVAVMDKRSGRSGGHKLKGPLECKRHNLYKQKPRVCTQRDLPALAQGTFCVCTHRAFTNGNGIQNQELAWDRLGESRRKRPFSRAWHLCRLPRRWLAGWRRPQERVKKAEQNFVPVLPGPYVMHSNTTITPRSVWGLKTLHTSTNDHISYRKPTTGTLLPPLAVRMSPAR
jgi:hypothetical protein